MAFRTRQTRCVTRLLVLRRLTSRQSAQCDTLRREAGRCWSDLVRAHKLERERSHWLSVRELELRVAHGYALHSQTVQALAQRLDANIQTARTLRAKEEAEGAKLSVYPYHTPEHQTVVWKDMAIRVDGTHILLSKGRGRPALRLPLPVEYRQADIRRAELLWRAGSYELCLTIDTGETDAPPLDHGLTAGVDLGEVHIAAIATSAWNVLVVSGRHLRACKRLRNKRHAAYQRRRARCIPGSRRWRQLKRRGAQASGMFYRQQRDTLHQASRKALTFCQSEGVATMAIGDVRTIHNRLHRGGNKQKIGQWAHGQFCHYLLQKAANVGIATAYIPEDYSSQTCSACGHQRSYTPSQRMPTCPGCGVRIHRDANGAANICSRSLFGVYACVHIESVASIRPIRVVRAALKGDSHEILNDDPMVGPRSGICGESAGMGRNRHEPHHAWRDI
ncbi:MAG: RNA-guided endonuclease InsQ/TnpB family protein [Ktedonobacterales bacterium]